MNAFIKLYDWFTFHRKAVWVLGIALFVIMGVLSACLKYEEDIFAFLPQDKEYTESMQVYSSINEASRIVVIFDGTDPDSITQAIDAFADLHSNAITEVDIDGVLTRLNYIYHHLPYFMTDEAYRLLDSIYAGSDTLQVILNGDKQLLSMPGTSFLYPAITQDPLHLVPLSRGLSGQYAGAMSAFTSYNGYMMTSDCQCGFAFYDSPYGSTETGSNAMLIDSLNASLQDIMQAYPSVAIRLLGAPVIAVNNAQQIKHDSIGAILLSLILILALLLYAFPRKRDIALIFLAIGFGWLFGMATLYIFVGKVSVIVLGIGAILIGISVNYPLHLLVHQRYTTTIKQTLQEVLSPLIIGNITTIGAFLVLIPLHSPALKQLGIFAAAMLLGTILFCILFLPHLMSATHTTIREIHCKILNRLSLNRTFIGILVMTIIIVCAGIDIVTSSRPLFDPNISHINYMTQQQREDFAWFEQLSAVSDQPLYLAESARTELEQRITKWDDYFTTHNADSLVQQVTTTGQALGFREDAFEPFAAIINQRPITEDLHQSATLAALWPGRFDLERVNAQVATMLTQDFDYIGLVCSVIVFIFLCISFRSLALGIIAFIPMLLSWVIIIACMHLFGLQFNIVNIILATFIFGQGDDYTIFVVEGLINQERIGKRLLEQYKQSIILSALVMLMAIGVLVFAKHPAMFSLGAVTLIGMTAVVTMAFIIPPILFRLYTRFNTSGNKNCK